MLVFTWNFSRLFAVMPYVGSLLVYTNFGAVILTVYMLFRIFRDINYSHIITVKPNNVLEAIM